MKKLWSAAVSPVPVVPDAHQLRGTREGGMA